MAKKNKKFNPLEHELVPKHEIVSKDEVEKLTEKYGPLKNFPRILIDDPALKKMDVKAGDIIKITRKSDLNSDIYYRVVVDV